jgi:membrane protein implicated in regulation of membrane protease activity
MLMDFIANLGKWSWLVLAAAFFVIELLAPGAFMLWLGLSALLVGLISLFVDWPWQYQLVVFAIFALVSLPIWRRTASRRRAISRSSIAGRMPSWGASSRWKSRSWRASAL